MQWAPLTKDIRKMMCHDLDAEISLGIASEFCWALIRGNQGLL